MINLEKNSIKNLEIDLKSFEDLSSKSKITIQTLQEDNNQLNNKINELEYNLK